MFYDNYCDTYIGASQLCTSFNAFKYDKQRHATGIKSRTATQEEIEARAKQEAFVEPPPPPYQKMHSCAEMEFRKKSHEYVPAQSITHQTPPPVHGSNRAFSAAKRHHTTSMHFSASRNYNNNDDLRYYGRSSTPTTHRASWNSSTVIPHTSYKELMADKHKHRAAIDNCHDDLKIKIDTPRSHKALEMRKLNHLSTLDGSAIPKSIGSSENNFHSFQMGPNGIQGRKNSSSAWGWGGENTRMRGRQEQIRKYSSDPHGWETLGYYQTVKSQSKNEWEY